MQSHLDFLNASQLNVRERDQVLFLKIWGLEVKATKWQDKNGVKTDSNVGKNDEWVVWWTDIKGFFPFSLPE